MTLVSSWLASPRNSKGNIGAFLVSFHQNLAQTLVWEWMCPIEAEFGSFSLNGSFFRDHRIGWFWVHIFMGLCLFVELLTSDVDPLGDILHTIDHVMYQVIVVYHCFFSGTARVAVVWTGLFLDQLYSTSSPSFALPVPALPPRSAVTRISICA